MTSYGFLRSLNKSQQREYAIQEQLSDGKAIHRPSDDPVKTVRSLRFNTNLSINEQFTQNLQAGQSWMENTDGAMSDLSSIMNKVNELVISADNTKASADLNTIGKQIDEMVNQIVAIGNTKIGNRYLFAGQSDSTQPFMRTTLTDPNSDKTQEVIVYNGDNSKISMPIQQGAVNPNQDSMNLTGADVFGPVTSIYGQQTVSALNRLLEIKNELGKTSAIKQTNQDGGVGTIGGTYTGTGYQNFDVRVDSADYTGRVMTASYSTDNGNSWNKIGANTGTSLDATSDPAVINLPNGVKFNLTDGRKISNSNANGGAVTIVKGAPITTYQVAVTGVAGGQVSGASYQSSTDGGLTWSAATAFAGAQINTAADPNNTALQLPNGSVFNIATSALNNNAGDTYNINVANSMNVTETAGTNGVTTVSAVANPSYQVKFTGIVALTGQVTTASYSTDGGATWTAGMAVNSIANPDESSITLPNGDILKVVASTKNNVNDIATIQPNNKQKDVYSFRVPQTAFTLNPSNSLGGAATLSGTYTGSGNTTYSVRMTDVGGGGHITGADYSIDGGLSWNRLSNYDAVQSNFSGGKATMTGSGIPATTLYQMHIDAVDANGKVTGASYSSSTDNGGTWSVFAAIPANNITDEMVNTDSTNSVSVKLPGGQIVHVAASKGNNGTGTPLTSPPVAGDIYTFTPVAFPPISTMNGSTVLRLPKGIQLTVAATAANAVNDSFSFKLPQGNGADAKWLSAVGTQYVQDDHDMQLKAQTQLGTRMAMYEMAGNVMQNENYTITNDVAQNEDIDMAKAITDFNTSKTVYESALSVGAKIMTKSLVDFL